MIKYIAGISGGPDSMVMLDIYRENITLVCHVNYQKRMSANRDSKIVRNYCQKYNIKFAELKVTSTIYSKYKKINPNFQALARLIRYDFFLKCGKKHKLNNLLVAHNKDDFLETAMMQLKRKSKTLFYGISKWSMYKSLIINRPLLNKRKYVLQSYCDKHKIPYGIDETNFLDIYERNIIRKQITKWTEKQFNTKYQSILNKNKKLHPQYIQTQKTYLLWEQSHWSLTFFSKLNKQLQYHLIYNIFSNLQLTNINHNKIILAITFINKGKYKSQLRLGNNYFFAKDNINLYIINNNK